MKRVVEVRGTQRWNKGAELMAAAVKQWCTAVGADCAVDLTFGHFHDRQRHDLLTVIRPYIGGKTGLAQCALQLMGPWRREAFGVVVHSQLSAVLDASGFAFGDSWGMPNVNRLFDTASRCNKTGAKMVLLPQAFGPFNDKAVAERFRQSCEMTELVFARDTVSLEHVKPLVDERKLRLAPDFTNLIAGAYPSGLKLPENYGCVVPNIKMIDNGSSAEREKYIEYLASCVKILKSNSVTPVVLLHEQKRDREIVTLLQEKVDFQVVDSPHPVHLKGVIGRSRILIGSRFHSLVSAMSQGIPVIGTSWSHKYKELFADYDNEKYLVSGNETDVELSSLIKQIVQNHAQITKRLSEKSEMQKAKTMVMWREVCENLHFELTSEIF